MDFLKEIEKELKKERKKNKDIKIKSVKVSVNGEDKDIILQACPPNGCPICPPIC